MCRYFGRVFFPGCHHEVAFDELLPACRVKYETCKTLADAVATTKARYDSTHAGGGKNSFEAWRARLHRHDQTYHEPQCFQMTVVAGTTAWLPADSAWGQRICQNCSSRRAYIDQKWARLMGMLEKISNLAEAGKIPLTDTSVPLIVRFCKPATAADFQHLHSLRNCAFETKRLHDNVYTGRHWTYAVLFQNLLVYRYMWGSPLPDWEDYPKNFGCTPDEAKGFYDNYKAALNFLEERNSSDKEHEGTAADPSSPPGASFPAAGPS